MRGEGIKSQIVETNAVGLGGNEFENGTMTVESGSPIMRGALLIRDQTTGRFIPMTNTTETPVAINPFEFKNDSDSTRNMPIRAIVFGRVRADLLVLGTTRLGDIPSPTRELLFDKIRATALCIPIQGTDISRTE